MEEMVVTSAHERLAEQTERMETAIYAALDSLDSYRATVDELLAEQSDALQPNVALQKRLGQFRAKATTMTTTIEDDVLTNLLFCVDRLFTVEPTENGKFL